MTTSIDRTRLAQLLERETASYIERNATSFAAHERSAAHLLGGVPMTWMAKSAAPFPSIWTALAGHESSTWTATS